MELNFNDAFKKKNPEHYNKIIHERETLWGNDLRRKNQRNSKSHGNVVAIFQKKKKKLIQFYKYRWIPKRMLEMKCRSGYCLLKPWSVGGLTKKSRRAWSSLGISNVHEIYKHICFKLLFIWHVISQLKSESEKFNVQ